MTRAPVLGFALVFIAWLSLGLAAAETRGADALCFYVATNGNDAWSGRSSAPNKAHTDGPLATIGAARDAVRKLKTNALDRDVIVQVRGGTYYLNQPIVLTPADSGTAEHPITYMAYPGERPVLSGGRPVTGWKTSDGKLYRAPAPAVKDKRFGFRQLRVGKRRQIRARYPNYDPDNPITGGWLFARSPEGPAIGFGTCMACIHNAGDCMDYDVDIPADGLYDYWMYVAMKNAAHTPKDVTGCTAISVDGGPKVLLMNLHDTGDWHKFEWRKAASLQLKKGKRRLRWENLKGGGIDFDLFALSDDPELKPKPRVMPKPAPGRHFMVVQAEDYVKAHGPQIRKVVCGPTFKSKTEIYVDPGNLKAWAGSPDPEVHVFPRYGWVSGIVPIAKIDLAKSRLVVDKDYPEEIWLGNRFFIENLAEELDAPGEWYLDRGAGTITYMRTDDSPDKVETVLAALDRVFDFRGDPSGKKPVSHVQIVGFTITDTDYSRKHKTWYHPDDAAIWMIGAVHCRVRQCLFHNIGGWALTIRSGSADNAFEGNTVVGAGMGGVYLDGSSHGNLGRIGPPEARPRRNLISGNHMYHCGKIFAHVAGVSLCEASDNIVRHNLVHHWPRYGLSIKYQSGGNVYEYNRVYQTNLETNDTGGIEIYNNFQGSTVRCNIVGDTIGLKTTAEGEFLTPFYSWGIYLDGMTSKVTVTGNIVYRNYLGGLMVNGGSDNTITNNIFVDGHKAQTQFNNYKGEGRNNKYLRNIVYYRHSEAATYSGCKFNPDWLASDYNLLWHVDGGLDVTIAGIGKGDTWKAWLGHGLEEHSLVADPLFVNPDDDDYGLKPDAPAFKLGFKGIDTSKIGLSGAAVRPPDWHDTATE